jgi:hypothetical protein
VIAIEALGWSVSVVLGILLLLQMEKTRYFLTPRGDGVPSFPPVTVIMRRSGELSAADSVRSLALQEYRGEMEILLPEDQWVDHEPNLRSWILLAHPEARVVASTEESLAAGSTSDLLLFIGSDTVLEPDAVATSVAHLIREDLDRITLVPRPVLQSAEEMLLVPLSYFLLFTPLPGFRSSSSTPDPDHREPFVLIHRRAWERDHTAAASSGDDAHSPADAPLREEVLSGRFVARRRVRSDPANDLFGAGVASVPRPAALAVVLVSLFTVPPLAMLLTGAFSWMVATILGLFLRLRVAIRTGEPIILTLLHPIAALAAALLLAREIFGRNPSGGSGT